MNKKDLSEADKRAFGSKQKYLEAIKELEK